MKKGKLGLLSWWHEQGMGFIRLRFVGVFHWKDTDKYPLLFSERNGYKRTYSVGKWSFKFSK